MKKAIKIMENLWQVGGGDLSGPGDAASYLIRFGDEAVLIDAGCGTGHHAITSNTAGCLPKNVAVTYLILTHCHFDHTGGAERLKNDLGCAIIAHQLDAVFLESGDSEVTAASWYGSQMKPLQVDMKLHGEINSIEIGDGCITAFHCPGHSPGSMVLTARLEDQLILFGQDVHGPVHPTLLSDPLKYQDSLQKILRMDADLLLEGHSGIFRGKDAVRKFIRSFLS